MNTFFAPVELANTQEIPLRRAERIAIQYISEAVTLVVTDGQAIVLKEYFNVKDPAVFAKVTAGESEIAIQHGERRLLGMLRGRVEVHLPKSFFGKLTIKTVSGRIECAGRLVLSEICVSSTSGRIALGNVSAGTAVLSTISGMIAAESLRAETDAHSTSGSIRIARAEGDGDFKTVSGAIEVAFHAVTGDIAASSTSGRIRVAVPPLLSFSVEAQSVSGPISVPISGRAFGGRHAVSGTVGDSPQTMLRLSTVSGRIEVVPAG